MEHKGTQRLDTPRLVLRRFVPEDLESFYQHCLSDNQVWRWTSYPQMEGIWEAQSKAGLFTPNWFAAYERPDRYSWAIAEKPEGPAIGRVFGMHPNDRTQEVELAYELGQAFWGQGYMTEAVRAVLRFFFEDVGFFRVHAYHADQNPASGRVMQKCGMRYEGIMRKACVCNGGRFDQVNYALLREEYRKESGWEPGGERIFQADYSW